MSESTLPGDARAAALLAVALVVAACLIGEAALGWVVAPAVLTLLVYAAVRAPLRHSLLALTAAALTLENPNDAPGWGQFHSPFYPVGAILLTHLNNALGVPGLPFSGMDVCLGVVAGVALARRGARSDVDARGRLATPRPLVLLSYASVAGTAYAFLLGMLRGGSFRFSLWQVEKVIYLPLLFLLFAEGLRGPRDHRALARVVLGAAALKAALALYIRETVLLPPAADGTPQEMPYATSHHDSMLFACASVILVAGLVERVGSRARRAFLLLMPLLVAGMIANNRRMVWVQIALVFVTLWFTLPETRVTRRVNRVFLALTPLLAVYLAIGWDQKGGFWQPAATVRSVVDPASDSSTMWREMENYDLLYTIRQSPLFGTGYGFGFWEVIPLPSIGYELERYCPHNSILGLLCFAGLPGFAAMTMLWAGGVFFAMRAYHAATRPADRAAALAAYGAILVYVVQCWGDMGLGSFTGVFSVAPALAVAGKLATHTGAWKPPARRSLPG